MITIKAFDLSIGSVVKRFFLMMAIVIILGFLNQFILAAVLAPLVAVTSIAGISVSNVKPKRSSPEKKNDTLRPVEKETGTSKAA